MIILPYDLATIKINDFLTNFRFMASDFDSDLVPLVQCYLCNDADFDGAGVKIREPKRAGRVSIGVFGMVL